MKILIYGATSAIAQSIARKYIEEQTTNADYVLVGRSEEKLKSVSKDITTRGGRCLFTVAKDLSDTASTISLTKEIIDRFGGFDLVLIAHGFLPDQLETATDEKLLAENFETNAMSYIHIMAIVARDMRSRGTGTIVVISSVAGDRGRASNYSYGAAKGAVSIFAQGLRNSLQGSGVNLLTVKPGLIDSPMTAGFPNKGALWSTPDKVADDTYRAVQRGMSVIYTPWFWRPIMWIIRSIPEAIFKRLSL